MPSTREPREEPRQPPLPATEPEEGPRRGERDTRLLAGRQIQMRDRLERRQILTQSRGRLYVDPTKIPAGVRYCWIRASTLGQPDDDNVIQALEMGWKPVPPDRHPELVPPSFGDRARPADHILKGGQILMERPEEICAEDDATLREINLQVLREVDSDRARAQNERTPTMPATRNVKHRTVVGREPNIVPAELTGDLGEGGGTFEE